MTRPMSTPMPTTAGQAHAVARQCYRAMLHHAAARRRRQTRASAASFRHAAMLAQMLELRQIRLTLAALLARQAPQDAEYLETRDLHPAAPQVEYDGFAVPRDGAA